MYIKTVYCYISVLYMFINSVPCNFFKKCISDPLALIKDLWPNTTFNIIVGLFLKLRYFPLCIWVLNFNLSVIKAGPFLSITQGYCWPAVFCIVRDVAGFFKSIFLSLILAFHFFFSLSFSDFDNEISPVSGILSHKMCFTVCLVILMVVRWIFYNYLRYVWVTLIYYTHP